MVNYAIMVYLMISRAFIYDLTIGLVELVFAWRDILSALFIGFK